MESYDMPVFHLDGYVNYSLNENDNSTNMNVTVFPPNETQFAVTVLTSPTLFWTRLIVQKYLVPIVVTCGIVGNFFNIIVLVNPKMRTSTNIYLMSLAICDSMYLLFSLTLAFLHCANKQNPVAAFYYIPYARVLTDLFGNTAVWLTVCFTLERYIAVRYPMRGKAWCTITKAKRAVLIIFVLCTVNTFPELFETKIVQIYTQTRTVQYDCKPTEFAKAQSYQIGYYWWYVAIFTFVPLLLLSIFNSLLIRSVWEASKKREVLSNYRVTGDNQRQNHEQQRVTRMLISVVLIFLFCQTPQAVLLVYGSYLKANRIPYPADFIRIAGNICNLLVQINASVNFLLYSYFSSKFRRTLKKVLCGWNKPLRSNAWRALSSTFRTKSASTMSTTATTSLTSPSYRCKRVTVVTMVKDKDIACATEVK